MLVFVLVCIFMSFLALQSSSTSFALIYCLLDVFLCECPIALPYGAVRRSAVCDCGIS